MAFPNFLSLLFFHLPLPDEILKVPAVSEAMSRNRFRDISRYLHLNNNENQIPRGADGHDPLFKIRPLHDIVLATCQTYFAPSKAISFDEAMMAFKGRLYFKQYIKGKPNPWGVKVWCAADSATGYLLNFSFYTGKETACTHTDGLGYSVVMDLGQKYLGKFHQFYFDNFFSSVKLAEDLLRRQTYSCATIRTNRKGWPADMKSKKHKKDTTIMRQKGNLVACLWQDKRTVCLLSTNSNPEMVTAQRKTKQGIVDKQIPQPVIAYNSNMGGVDLNDQLRSYYPIGRKSKKWWRCTLWYLFEVACVNAFIVYRLTTVRAGQKPMTHVQFQVEVARELLRGNISRSSRSKEFPSVSGLGKAQPEEHSITRLFGRKRQCFQCRVGGKKTASNRVPETVFGCATCNVHLCKGLCFATFHSQLN